MNHNHPQKNDDQAPEVEPGLFFKALQLLLKLGMEGNLIIYGPNDRVIEEMSTELDQSIEKKAPGLVIEMFTTVLSQIPLDEATFDYFLSNIWQIHIHTDGKQALRIKVVPKAEIITARHARKLIRQKLND